MRRLMMMGVLALLMVGCGVEDDDATPNDASASGDATQDAAGAGDAATGGSDTTTATGDFYTLSAESLTFDDPTAETQKNISITNTGTERLLIASGDITGEGAGSFSIKAVDGTPGAGIGTSLAPGAGIEITIELVPQIYDAPLDATLNLRINAPATKIITVPISSPPVPTPTDVITITPTHLDFGEVEPFTTVYGEFVISNPTDTRAHITRTSFSSFTSPGFSLLESDQITPDEPATVYERSTRNILLRYAPTDQTGDGGELYITIDDGTDETRHLVTFTANNE